MACAASEIIAILERLAPEETAEPQDSVGLQLGSRSRAVSRLLLALEITGAVVDEAQKTGADMIVTHHPLFFRPVARIDE
ncbi:MAG: Nif3-like dinuclear metal center hexameric protein, partial [Clostridiales bacterium]|nr:Nif3-like dinuclear metal center hexameric protein [Clostridiales bacterium]